MAADGLDETGRRGGQLHRLAEIVEGDGREGGLLGADGDRGGAHQATTLVAGVDDRAVDHVDPTDEVVREPEPVGGPQRLQIAEFVGRWIVVVGEARSEDRLVEAGHGFRRDPAQAGDARLDPHDVTVNSWTMPCVKCGGPSPSVSPTEPVLTKHTTA